MFSLSSGAISSPSVPASLPATFRLNNIFSHSLAGPYIKPKFIFCYFDPGNKNDYCFRQARVPCILISH